MRTTLLALLLLAMLATQSYAIDSKIRFRIYKKTLHEMIEKNGPFVSEYTTASLGSVDVSDIAMKDSHLSIFPQSGSYEEFETELKFIEGQGAEITLNEFQFELKGKVEGKDGLLKGNIERIFIKLSVIKGEEADKSSSFTASDLPQFDIEKLDVEFDKATIKWTIDGTERMDNDLLDKTLTWLDAAINGQMIAAKFLINMAQQKLADYITENVNMETYKGKISFSEITFFEEYAEMSVITTYDLENSGSYKVRDSEPLAENAGDDSNAIELVFDENIINTGLYAAFHSDSDFSLRKVLRIEDSDNEYAKMFDTVLQTQVLSQAWKELGTEFGSEKRVDARCSFGKGMFGDIIEDVNPSKVRFLKGSSVDFTLGFGCSVVVETSEGKWENFRSFYAELYAKLKLEISSNDAIKKIKLAGDAEELKATRIKIFKREDSMVAEETAMSMMLNMGLNMAKYQIKKALDIPQIGYPKIKECTGLTLLRPAISIYDGFVVISTDLSVKRAQKGCDIMTPPSFESKSGSDFDEEDNIGQEQTEEKEIDEVKKEDL